MKKKIRPLYNIWKNWTNYNQKNVIDPISRYWRQFIFTLELFHTFFHQDKNMMSPIIYSSWEARWLRYFCAAGLFSFSILGTPNFFLFGSFYNKLLTIRSSPKSKGVSRYMEIGLIRSIAKTLKNFFLLLPPHRSIHIYFENFQVTREKEGVNLL